MCLITACPKGTVKQGKEIEGFIRNGMSSNTDGSGFMYKKNGSNLVNIDKGFVVAQNLIDAINDLKLEKEDELVIHHRIGTSGDDNVTNMHPFLVSDNNLVMQSAKGEFDFAAMMHNGVFNSYTDRQSPYSDTYHFIRDFLATPEIFALMKRSSLKFMEIFKSVISYNKLAFLFPDRDLMLLGNFEEDGGYFHSNTGYKRYTYDKGGSSTYDYSKRYWPKDNNQNSRIGRQLRLPANDLGDGYPNYDDEHYDYDNEYSAPVHTNLSKTLEGAGTEFLNTKTAPHIKFNNKDIVITKDNFNDFLIRPVINYNEKIRRGLIYFLEAFDPETEFTFIKRIGENHKELHAVNPEKLFKISEYYVKKSSTSLYEGLHNLILATDRKISPSMSKKISTCLQKKINKTRFDFKTYGSISWHDLHNFHQNYKPIVAKSEEVEEVDDKLATNAIGEIDNFGQINEALITNAEIVKDTES